MVQMTCPVCKNRCLLTVEQNGSDILVQGNKCARGELHAREELEGKGKIVTYHASTCFEQGQLPRTTLRATMRSAPSSGMLTETLRKPSFSPRFIASTR